MAVTNKDFKIKYGLIVEGANATVNGNQVLTETESDQYILNLIGGETLVKSVSDEFNVSVAGELSLDRSTVDAYYDAAGDAAAAQAAAIAAAALDATSKADAAEDAAIAAAALDATSKADAAEDAAIAAAALDATSKANAAQAAAELTASNALSSAVDDLEAYADQAEVDAKAYTDTRETAITTAYQAYADAAEQNAKDYADDKVADLVNGAPALLDTLNELAAALEDNPDVIADLRDIADGKQDTLTAGENISIVDDVISVTGLVAADISDFDSQAAAANSGLWDTYGSAASAGTNAENFAQGLVNNLTTTDIEEGSNLYFTNQRAIDAVGGTIGDAIDQLDTDDIEEGYSNLYFTDLRARGSAGDLLAGAQKSNIEISFVDGVLSIAAENGVANSTTDDLTEGDSNLYFTDERAIDAVSGADIYPNAVIINNLTKHVASQLTVATAGIATGISWAKADYRSAEFVVKVAYGNHTEISKVLLTLDVNDNIAITEYGNVTTNGSASSISADISGTDARLRVTTVNNNSTVTVIGTLIQ